MTTTLATAGDYANIGIVKDFKVCCRGNGNISIRSVPAVITPTTITPAIVTQIPIITDANLTLKRKA